MQSVSVDIIDSYCEEVRGQVDNATLIESLHVNIPTVITIIFYVHVVLFTMGFVS